MTLSRPPARCRLCGQEIDPAAPFYSSWGVVFEPPDPLYPFCEAPLHWDCFAAWPERERFARGYFQMWVESSDNNFFWGRAYLSEQALLKVNRAPAGHTASLRLAVTARDITIYLEDWEAWLAAPERTMAELHPLEQAALREVIGELQQRFPRADDLLNAVDWARVRLALTHKREAYRAELKARPLKPGKHNAACRSYMRSGVRCPGCKNVADNRLVDRGPQEKASFECAACGRGFELVDVMVGSQYDRLEAMFDELDAQQQRPEGEP